MPKFIDLTGNKYGRLMVIQRARLKSRRTMWECKCECGNTVVVSADHLKNGHTKSCGCYRRDVSAKHNMCEHELYPTWNNMMQRCNNPKHIAYERYGGAGIKVCDEWKDITAFINWANESGYDRSLTLDRIDNAKGYSPENCKWSTKSEQAINRRTSKMYEYKNEIMTLNQWSRKLKIPQSTLWYRASKTNDVNLIFKGGEA